MCNPAAVADVAEAVRRCLALDGSHTLNVAGPEVLTLRQVAEAVGRVIGRAPRFHVRAGGAARRSSATRAGCRRPSGWQPPTRFEDGVREWLAATADKPAAQARA